MSDYIMFSKAEINTTICRPALVTNISEAEARNGKVYCKITLSDGDSTVVANMFDVSSNVLRDLYDIKPATVVNADLRVSEYNGAKSFVVSCIQKSEDQSCINDYMKLPPIPSKVMYDYITATLHDNVAGYLLTVTESILDLYAREFCTSSAAVAMHHNMLGGLLYHTYRMLQSAVHLCEVYPELDKELMICGTILHDIGKIKEYKTNRMGEATVSPCGALFGHLYIGAELVHSTAVELGCADNEKIILLQHMILSHHGVQQWGAVVPPAIPEAFVLHFIDDIDAKVYMCNDITKSLEGGTTTEKKPFGLDGRLYKRLDAEDCDAE